MYSENESAAYRSDIDFSIVSSTQQFDNLCFAVFCRPMQCTLKKFKICIKVSITRSSPLEPDYLVALRGTWFIALGWHSYMDTNSLCVSNASCLNPPTWLLAVQRHTQVAILHASLSKLTQNILHLDKAPLCPEYSQPDPALHCSEIYSTSIL